MLIASNVTLRYWFYPIGNTPAVNLLRSANCATGDRTRVLCLACGDARNVLFTLWSETPTIDKCHEFTTCDSEPAVLARNILLYSFLMDQRSAESLNYTQLLWEMYYHFFLTSESMEALLKHLNGLLKISASMAAWNNSQYAKTLRIMSSATLRKIREFWQSYLDFYNSEGNQTSILTSMQDIFRRSGASEHATFLNGSRSLGVHGLSPSATAHMSNALRAYWKTGVVAGNQRDAQNLRREGGGRTNALFALSSAPLGNLAVHYGCDPLLGFRLPQALDTNSKATDVLERLADAAKSQFKAWCESFISHVVLDTTTIYFHCGEALSLCYEVQNHDDGYPKLPKDFYLYSTPWSCESLDLTNIETPSTAYNEYDVIDCSNISDHVGILNLLPATVPLLSKTRHATLYTETLLPTSEDTERYLDELLRADVSSIFLIAGIAPTGLLLGVSTEHFGSEILMRGEGSRNQIRMRLDWKRPWGGDSNVRHRQVTNSPALYVGAEDMSTLFFRWYLEIFSNAENISNLLSVHLRRASGPVLHDLNHYTRMTLVALIILAVKNVHTDWNKCISLLLTSIEQDRTLIVGNNSLQELYMLLHMSGLYTTDALRKEPKIAAMDFAGAMNHPTSPGVPQVLDLPSIVTIALTVPRESLGFLSSTSLDQVGTPGLHLAVYNSQLFENSFFSLYLHFGKLFVNSGDNTGSIDEHAQGWRGTSDLIVTCPMPAFQFLVGNNRNTRVALVINSTPASSHFATVLGPQMRVYDTSIKDHDNVHIFPNTPTNVASLGVQARASNRHCERLKPKTKARLADSRLQYLCVREDLSCSIGRQLLLEGVPVETSQKSPCTLVVKLGPQSWTHEFPFPIDQRHSTTRIARKQAWVEVIVPISSATQAYGYALCPFPVVHANDQISTWGLSRVNLSQQPSFSRNVSPSYLSGFLGMTLSERERQSSQAARKHITLTDPPFDMKETVAALFSGFAGYDTTPHARKEWKGFRLACGEDSDTLILASALRHDLDSGSLCLDCHVVPLTNDRIPTISGALVDAVRQQKLLSVRISKDEEILWKRALPSLVERCRTSWNHTVRCEYRKISFQCPLSVAHGQSPICTCGEGVDIHTLPKVFHGFSSYATRIAIPTLSAIPYVEKMAVSPLAKSGAGT